MKQAESRICAAGLLSRPARGAWIETLRLQMLNGNTVVAPRAGRVD